MDTHIKDTGMKVHTTVYDTDMHGNIVTEEIEVDCYFDEWADFDD